MGTEAPEMPTLVEVVGYIDTGDGLEGFLVEVNGKSDRPSGGKYHITWSIDRDKGYKPVNTNDHVNKAKPVKSVRLSVEPQLLR